MRSSVETSALCTVEMEERRTDWAAPFGPKSDRNSAECSVETDARELPVGSMHAYTPQWNFDRASLTFVLRIHNMPSIEPSVKRRKVRKGTQSCWECRRRKVRCIFSTPTNSVCNNCNRRKTSCISQEIKYTNFLSARAQGSSNELGERLSRVEKLFDHFANSPSLGSSGLNETSPGSFANDSETTGLDPLSGSNCQAGIL